MRAQLEQHEGHPEALLSIHLARDQALSISPGAAAQRGAGWILGRQYLRAASSIRANVEEAQAGESRADFIHKLGIAQKEARESLYWLRVLAESELVPRERVEGLISETEELLNVITSIILNTKRKDRSTKARDNS